MSDLTEDQFDLMKRDWGETIKLLLVRAEMVTEVQKVIERVQSFPVDGIVTSRESAREGASLGESVATGLRVCVKAEDVPLKKPGETLMLTARGRRHRIVETKQVAGLTYFHCQEEATC